MTARAPVTDWASGFDHLDPQWAQDPYSIWRELRQKCPVAHTDRFDGVYLPTRYSDIRAVAYDTDHFSSRRAMIREGERISPPSPPATSDPPAHRGERQILLAPFTPQAVGKLEARTRTICRELLNRLSDRTECDAAEEYAQEIPSRVTAILLGIPEHDGPRFRKWVRDFMDFGAADPAVARRVRAEVDALFGEEIAKRKVSPGDDLVSHLLKARLNGEPLSEEQITGTTRLLFFAGIDTTWSMIAASLWHLATHEDDRKRLVAEPNLIPSAVEEFLRAYAPVAVAREIMKDTEIGGCPVKAGETVMLAYGAANRDPTMFPDPDRVVLDRAENQHATFGLGIHRCIGANLARMEIRVAVEEWLCKFPNFMLRENAIVKWSEGTVRGPRQIPVTIRQ
ncbi:cytochrome [Bradyrhizobium centrolobii]|uniref:Cytochrome n=1 Tax=Bradyrhizobium centrolobii TaxID=1505087 RepID=A0A176Y9U5_9BRAD|nr:cytochrome P450 [Bradyrhizobium centrolobii]OAE97701.1 cytochrome [Bradyrhizobium centrolobii]